MRKLIFLAVAAFVCSAVNAQLVTTSEFKSKKSESNTIWMLRAGLTSAGISGDDAEGAKSIAGYNVSIEFNKSFATNFYWGSGLVFGNKGYKYSEDGEEDKTTIAKLELPVNVGYKYAITEDIKLDGHVGAYIGYDLFGKNKYTYDGDSEEVDLGDFENYNRLGYGLQFGIGVWYQKFNFNITYQKGLNKLIDDTKAYENNWMFSVGYAF